MFQSLIEKGRLLVAQLEQYRSRGIDGVAASKRLASSEIDAWFTACRKALLQYFGTDSVELRRWEDLLDEIATCETMDSQDHPGKEAKWTIEKIHKSMGLLSELQLSASQSNLERVGHATGSPAMKLITLAVLMLIGLSGFYILETRKAIMWLLFVVIAIPPLLAVLFESEKLSGAHIVTLYKAGLKGLPLIGKSE